MRVESRSRQLNVRDYIDQLASSGRHHFTSREARAALGVSADATKLALKQTLPAGKYYLRVYDYGDEDFGLDQSYSVCFGAEAKPVQ